MTRAEQSARVAELRARGMLLREIAAALGISVQWAGELCRDPEGKEIAARRKRYQGTCIGCGKPTNGSDGPRLAPLHCVQCAPRIPTKWGKDEIIAAIHRWADLYGEQPTVLDWNPALARLGNASDLDRIEMRLERGNHRCRVQASQSRRSLRQSGQQACRLMSSERLRYHPVRGRRPLGDPLPPHATGISPIRWHTCLMSPHHAATEASLSLPMKRALVAARLQQQQAHILRQAAIEAPLPARHTAGTLPGDSRKLRGIPAIGIGVAGHIPGTHPEQAACR